MANPLLIKSFVAWVSGSGVPANRPVYLGPDANQVNLADLAGYTVIGVTGDFAAAAGERVDVVMIGIADVKLGGTVALNQPLTAGASGAVAATTGQKIFGIALDSGVAGDIIPVRLDFGTSP